MLTRFLQFHRRVALQGAKRPAEYLLLCSLLPFSLVYGAIGWLRSQCYQWHLFTRYRAAVPVISVGNLAVGGTGKTPVVDWLVKEFMAQGKRPAVISRGYGGTFSGSVGLVSTGSGPLLSAAVAGDEPYLLARRNPQALVLIARKRADGVKTAVEDYAADLIILDDGYQHRAVARDVDLLLLDAARPLANGWPLPAGMLREFPAALKRADLLLQTRSDGHSSLASTGQPLFTSQHRLADYAVRLDGKQLSFNDLAGQRLFAFAGIAAPDSFFVALSSAGVLLAGQLALPDHNDYTAALLKSIKVAAQGCDGLITTEKDAVKLSAEMFNLPCYQVPMNINIENIDEFKAELSQRLWRNQNVSTS